MSKIPKNLSDKDMFKDYKEEKKEKSLFDIAREFDKNNAAAGKKNNNNIKDSYIDAKLAVDLEKELLKLKLDLYKEGIVDYQIKVKREDNKIILVPMVKKHK